MSSDQYINFLCIFVYISYIINTRKYCGDTPPHTCHRTSCHREGGSSSLINRSMYEFSLTFTVVDQKYQFEHCIGKTIQRVSQSMDCVREFFFVFFF